MSLLESSQVRTFAVRQPFRRSTSQHDIIQSTLFTKLPLFRLLAIFIDYIHIRFDCFDLGIRVHPAAAAGNQCPLYKADRSHHVTALFLGEQGMTFSFKQTYVFIMPDHYIQITKLGCLFEEAYMSRMEPVETACDQHFWSC